MEQMVSSFQDRSASVPLAHNETVEKYERICPEHRLGNAMDELTDVLEIQSETARTASVH